MVLIRGILLPPFYLGIIIPKFLLLVKDDSGIMKGEGVIVLGKKWCVCSLLGMVFGLGILLAGSGVEARTVWREIATPHFRVIFPETLRESAQEVANIAEELLPRVEAFLQAHLDFQPAIVLTEDSDTPEGYTDPLQGAIHLAIAEPYEVLSNGTGFGEWVGMVLAHELTHLVHLGAVGENLEWLRSLLGYVVLPNVVQPFWVWEGYAMYGEGMLTGRGVKNPFYAMVLRTQALSGELLPHYLLRGYSFPRKWPGRLNVYIYGASLVEYIAQTFGEEKLAELSRRRSESVSLFGFDRAVQGALGISVSELWHRWAETVQNQAQDDLRRVMAAGLSPVTECTSEGYATGGVALSPDGSHLVYALSHPDFRPGLRWKDLRTGKKELLVRGSVIGRPVFSPDGEKLVYAKITRDGKTSYGDLYLYDLKRKKEQRLTVRERAFSPVFWGGKILFVRRNRFPEGVFALDVDSGVIQPVFEFDRDFHPVTLVVSGDTLFVSGWRNGVIEINLVDGKTKALSRLLSGSHLTPIFSVYGRYLFFSAALEGIFDACALDMETNHVFRLTRVASGFLEPVFTERGLYGLFHTALGFRVGFVSEGALLWEKVVLPEDPTVQRAPVEFPQKSYPESYYRPWRWLFPRFWVPLPGGFLVTARDPLGFHEYSLSYEERPRGTWRGDFSYRGNFTEPEIAIDLHGENERWTYGVTLDFPLVVEEFRDHTLSIGYERFWREDSLYPGYWEGWFARVETNRSEGNDHLLVDWGGAFQYRRGLLGDRETESMVGTWWGKWRKAGDSGPIFQVEASLGTHNLPRFFALGGWETSWPVAGYPKETLRGRIAGRLRLALSWPITTFDAPFFSMGIVQDLVGAIFLEGGCAGDTPSDVASLFSVGGELTVRAFVAEEIPLFFTVGYAKPLKPEYPGEWRLELGMRFR